MYRVIAPFSHRVVAKITMYKCIRRCEEKRKRERERHTAKTKQRYAYLVGQAAEPLILPVLTSAKGWTLYHCPNSNSPSG